MILNWAIGTLLAPARGWGDRHTDLVTYKLNGPRGLFSEREINLTEGLSKTYKWKGSIPRYPRELTYMYICWEVLGSSCPRSQRCRKYFGQPGSQGNKLLKKRSLRYKFNHLNWIYKPGNLNFLFLTSFRNCQFTFINFYLEITFRYNRRVSLLNIYGMDF